jgi:hypothetical protein
MRNPLISEIRRIRARMDRERARNPDRDEVAESRELLLKVCDVIIDDQGKPRYITNGKKMYDVFIAPRLAKEAARSRNHTRRRASSGRNSRSRSADGQRRGAH